LASFPTHIGCSTLTRNKKRTKHYKNPWHGENACNNGGNHSSHQSYNQTKHKCTTYTWTKHPFPFFELYGHPSHQFLDLTPNIVQAVRLECTQHNKLSGTHLSTSKCPLPHHEPIFPSGEIPYTSTSLNKNQMGNPINHPIYLKIETHHVDQGAPLLHLVPQCPPDLIFLRKMEVYTHNHHRSSPCIGTNSPNNYYHLLPHFKYMSSLKIL
jgi:hypothetical protein